VAEPTTGAETEDAETSAGASTESVIGTNDESEQELSATLLPEGLDVEAEIEATVQALREEALADPGDGEAPVGLEGDGTAPEPARSTAAGVDYVLYATGLMVLLVAAGRRRIRG
jgi:hypothetical protein